VRLELTGRHVDITPALRRLVDTKLSRLERLLNDRAVSAQAVLTLEKHRHRADITLHARGEKFLHGVGTAGRWETSLTEAIGKISQQAQRIKGKWQDRKRNGARGVPATVARGAREPVAIAVKPVRAERERIRAPRILRASRQPIKPMTLGDAAREVDAGGDGIVIFRDVETAAITVLFRRPDGELALVETEA
jgi:putative sigma-54 modulation protein